MTRTAAWSLRAAILLAPAVGLAGPVVGGVVARPPAELPADAANAFESGVDEAPGGRARRIASAAPPKSQRYDEGLAALKRGEQKYLDVELEAAKEALGDAVDAFLDEPTDVNDAKPAARAVLRMAQVCIALKRRKQADRVIERALLALPRFPAGSSPPPDLRARIDAARRRLQPQFGATLSVTTGAPGAQVTVNGVFLGVTPLRVDGLARRPVRVVVTPAGEPAESRLVDLASGSATVEVVSAETMVTELRDSIVSADDERGWTAAARLQASFQADATCIAVMEVDRVVVARLDASRRRVLGGNEVEPPSGLSGWRALGRFCSAEAPPDLSPQVVTGALWPSDPRVSGGGGGFGRRGWGWTAVGVGAVSWGAATFFALEAFDADDRFGQTGSETDKQGAQTNALIADVAIVTGVVLVGTGLYLLLTD